eukprot:GHVN01001449.1.p6 GENE.GHVN01001449.1~~GHVN01001449.1.p6  ORF type:complete len:126 (+),score=19.68 GHVN01001449.1:3139-3516(+)
MEVWAMRGYGRNHRERPLPVTQPIKPLSHRRSRLMPVGQQQKLSVNTFQLDPRNEMLMYFSEGISRNGLESGRPMPFCVSFVDGESHWNHQTFTREEAALFLELSPEIKTALRGVLEGAILTISS